MLGVISASASCAFAAGGGCAPLTFDLSHVITNPLFGGTPGNCPTVWVCSGSPAPGFASYVPTVSQYPGVSPLPATSAYSPTTNQGSGVIRQLTLGSWVGGLTYLLNFWVGLPATEPNGTTPVAGWPGSQGAARLYLTAGNDFSQVKAYDIPSPTSGKWASNPISFTLPTNSPAVGKQIGIMIYVSASYYDAANFDIMPFSCPV